MQGERLPSEILFCGLLASLLSQSSGCTLLFREAGADADASMEDIDASVKDAGASMEDIDAPAEVTHDAVDGACSSFSRYIDTCSLDQAQASLVLSMPGIYRYSTDTGVIVAPNNSSVLIGSEITSYGTRYSAIVVRNFRIAEGTWLVATGSLPLALVSLGTASVDGRILVHSGLVVASPSSFEIVGAGSSIHCTAGAGTNGADLVSGGGGGGGGSFQGKGGAGGDGNLGTGGGSGGQGGNIEPEAPMDLTGGCKGGDGGVDTNANPNSGGGKGGAGGGAVFLLSKGSMTINGAINASGAGGQGGLAESGGGGGGSGGFVRIEAASISVGQSGVIVANGGGGGEGSGSGQSGETLGVSGGTEFLNGAGGAGGNSGDTNLYGGDGGNGSGLNSLAGNPGQNTAAGAGGGGGGAGYIQFLSTDIDVSGGLISPSHSTTP